MKQKILIVGGVAGGAGAAARLRRLDENAEIIMFERGEYISFANCGLPYYIGGEIKDKSALTIQTPENFNSSYNVDVRISSEVISIDRSTKTVTVKNLDTGERYNESYDKLILSPGAAPIVPNIDGIHSDKVFTLRTIPDTYRIKDFIDRTSPKNVVLVGGGSIGIEMAENLSNIGISVSIVELSNQVITMIDYDMASEVHKYLKKKGVTLHLGKGLEKIEETPNGLTLTLSDGEITTDMVILAVGVRPEGDIAKEAGLDVNKRGGIIVDEHMQTSDENIFAVGDAIEVVNFVTKQKAMIPLAGPANKQARIVADYISGINSSYNGTQGSAILRVFDMTVATTGINEKLAKSMDIDYEKSFTYSSNHAGFYPGVSDMLMKIIFDKTSGKILGCQIVGFEGVDKGCDVIAVAIRAGMTASDLTELELCYSPPYSSAKDPVNMAGYVIENIVTGKIKNFHWDEIKELQNRKDVVLLDTRSVKEYENGHIEGFINIPFDSMRNRMEEIPKDKPVYVICQSGMRGYVACRALKQNGYDVYNMSGGYLLYKSITK